MTFIWPLMLASLSVVPLFVLLYALLQRRRQRIVKQYGNLGLAQDPTGQRLGARRHLPAVLFLAGLSILLVALARPQTEVSLPHIEGTIILAFDVSGSMAANDMEPTRMEAAKAAAREFVQHQPATVQIGIVAFSDSGLSVQVPTNDQEILLAAINRLAPERGTSLGSGILASLNTIEASGEEETHLYSNLTPVPTPTQAIVPPGSYTSAAIVLLSDGENNVNPNPLAAAKAAADRGVRIYTVGLGSPIGTTLHVNGFTVHTQLDEPMLKQIAEMTGGNYYNAESAQELSAIYENLDTQLTIKPEKTEVTSVFAGASVVILMLGGFLSLLWFSRFP